MGLAIPLALHAVIRRMLAQPPGAERRLRLHAELSATLATLLLVIWALAGMGVFWPFWPWLALGILLAAHAIVVYRHQLPGRAREQALVQRVDVLTRTRSGALDVQAAELRRIERDLHDGAQARLVALSMHLGRAEERVADQPEIAELLRHAREDAGAAISELRDLARGIAPPILADRGLTAAIEALARRSAIGVTIDADPDRRPLPVVETAAYFVVAEALTNVAKHAGGAAAHVRVTLDRAGTLCSRSPTRDPAAQTRMAAGSPGCAAGSRRSTARSPLRARPAAARRSARSCHAGCDRRGPRAAARGDRRAAARERHRRRRAGRGRTGLQRIVAGHKPDLAIVDVRLPPTFTDEGLRAAIEARRRHPGLGVLVLSQYVEPVYTTELLASGEAGVGYLLKERVGEVRAFIDAVQRVAGGGTALDREVVSELMRARQAGAGGDDTRSAPSPRVSARCSS